MVLPNVVGTPAVHFLRVRGHGDMNFFALTHRIISHPRSSLWWPVIHSVGDTVLYCIFSGTDSVISLYCTTVDSLLTHTPRNPYSLIPHTPCTAELQIPYKSHTKICKTLFDLD